MKHIIQEDENGCGVACVAMLANVSYGMARKTMFGRGDVKPTSTADLRKALLAFSLKPADLLIPLRTRHYSSLRERAILKVNVRKRNYWHWVVWNPNQGILDPAKPRDRYKRLRSISYLTVSSGT